MAGLYIHIPFCKRICTYCDFYKTTAVSLIPAYSGALELEMKQRAGYLGGQSLETIYLGGGTPSLMKLGELKVLFDMISRFHTIQDGCEITLEANPDDLSFAVLSDLRKYTPVNRLSIGIQSFSDTDLERLGRRHTSLQAVQAVENAIKAGFTNLTVDLIYGLPHMDLQSWEANLRKVFTLDIQHLSAYHLTLEPGTALARMHKKGLLSLPAEDQSRLQFQLLHSLAMEKGFEHYEISNLAKRGFRSKHNSNYWAQQAYLGLGPSAHSFDLVSRQWNIPNVRAYIEALQHGQPYFEKELLDEASKHNEFLMLSLRTAEGLDTKALSSLFGVNCAEETERNLLSLCRPEWIIRDGTFLRLSPEGWMVSDYITAEMMWV